MAVDSTGNIYIAELNHVIRKIDTGGNISTVAGNGSSPATGDPLGDGGQATAVSFKGPQGVAVDSTGNLYIADGLERVIRKVTKATGIISTVAGTPWTSGNAGDGGQATSATLSYPYAVAFDASGNMYIADFTGARIRKVTTGGIISTVAGGGTTDDDGGLATDAILKSPTGLALDSTGNLYIAESGANKIRKVAAGTGIISTVAGTGSPFYSGDNGPATAASLFKPMSVTVDSSKNLYIADQGNFVVRKVNAALGTISTVAGNGVQGSTVFGVAATATSLNVPTGVALDSAGNLLIGDQNNNRVSMVLAKAGPSVSASPAGGTYYSAQTVTLTASTTATIYYTLDGSDPTASGTRSSFSTTGQIPLSTNKTLKYYAVNADGASSVVTQVYTFLTATVPDRPTGVIAGAGNASATVSFYAPFSNGGSPITGYTVFSSPAGGIDSNAGSTATTHIMTGLTNGTSYTFTVKATNAVGTSASSDPSVSVTPVTFPGAPTNIVATPGNGQASISFTAPDSNGGANITSYLVTAWPDGAVATGSGSPITVIGLDNGTAYTFVVQAINTLGLGDTSVESNTVTPFAPVINGACGTSNGGLFTSAPSSDLCATGGGTASAVTGTGPWNWTCIGENGGTTASCSADVKSLKPGDCDNNGSVSSAEVQSAINMSLGMKAVAACVDVDRSGSVSSAELQKVINASLGL